MVILDPIVVVFSEKATLLSLLRLLSLRDGVEVELLFDNELLLGWVR